MPSKPIPFIDGHNDVLLALHLAGHGAGAFPESERAAKETLAIPVYPEVSRQQIEYVVSCVREFYVGADAAALRAVQAPAI